VARQKDKGKNDGEAAIGWEQREREDGNRKVD